ncbi:hypothetical protein PV327_011083 [Microctonus hyperodae]|uniref:Uncharacterized protein n=1 Tax=Microctonus hyperodae TaxID=165561 RepID=A0AA39FRK8_MICHY|nr:hypothetical protein PV327_011083 [Microctonus hyperodae]
MRCSDTDVARYDFNPAFFRKDVGEQFPKNYEVISSSDKVNSGPDEDKLTDSEDSEHSQNYYNSKFFQISLQYFLNQFSFNSSALVLTINNSKLLYSRFHNTDVRIFL